VNWSERISLARELLELFTRFCCECLLFIQSLYEVFEKEEEEEGGVGGGERESHKLSWEAGMNVKRSELHFSFFSLGM